MIAFLVLETLMIGVFCALDLVLFYLFFEGGLIPMFLIIGVWGGARRVYASFKFFLYTLLGSVLMLLAMMAMYWHAGTTDIPTLLTHKFPADMQWWLWLAFFASFAVKMPMWPVHTWLPDAHVEAPTAGSVILAGILLKMGGYGFLRFSLPMFPLASQEFAPLVFALSVIAIIYTSLVALAQEDMKKLIAYSSSPTWASSPWASSPSPCRASTAPSSRCCRTASSRPRCSCASASSTTACTRARSRPTAASSTACRSTPSCFMVFTMANVGLPGTCGFVGEFLTLLGAFKVNTWVAFLATIGVILSAAYALYLYRRMIFGALEKPALQAIADLGYREMLVFAPLVLLAILFGFYPAPLLDVTAVSVKKLVVRLRGGHQGGLGLQRALAEAAMTTWTQLADLLRRCIPEIVLVVGAMALLMLGVFRPESDARGGGHRLARDRRPGRWPRGSSLQQPAGTQTLFDGAFVVDGFAPLHEGADLRWPRAGALLLSFDYMRADAVAEVRVSRCWCCWRPPA